MSRLLLSIVGLGIAIHVAGCARAPEAQPPEVMPEVTIAQGALKGVERMDIHGASVERGMYVVVGTHACLDPSSCFSCYQCHGLRGEGSSFANFPRLTGQSFEYLYQSLRDFASARRPNPTMQEVVRGLTDEQMRDVAAYYAAIRPSLPSLTPSHDERGVEQLELGRTIALEGSSEPVVQACSECHGTENAAPAAPIYPFLAGQHAGYIEDQLRAFRSGVREDPTQIMNHIASQLTDGEMNAVAQYFASLQPPLGAELSATGSAGSL